MLLNADLSTNKTIFLVQKYIDLIKNGVSPQSILFLVPNSYRKKIVFDLCKKEQIDTQPINTFQGLVYRTVNENWEMLSSKIKIGDDKSKPNLCSMELSQYIMKRCVDEVGFNDYFSKINLLHQLFRRYYLIVQNDLDEKEVATRSKILNETWGEDAQKVLKKFEEKTLQHRCFDYLRQLSLFKYVFQNTDYFKNIKYLLLDDGDEITQFELNFIKSITPQLKDYYILYDKNGASRAGYLSAKKDIEKDFIKIFNEKPVLFSNPNKITQRAEILLNNFCTENKKPIENFDTQSFLTRLQMIQFVCNKIKTLIKDGVNQNEIAIIAPEIDFYLENFLKKHLPENSFEFLTGNKKLSQDKSVKNFLTIIKLANPSWNLKIEQFEINSLLNNFLNIPLKYCQNIFTEFKRIQKLEFFELENKKHETDYKNLLSTIENIKKLSLSDAIKLIKTNFDNFNQIKIDFLLKQVQEFEYLFSQNVLNKNLQKNIICQFENSMIAENSIENEINLQKIIISTPQKFIDLGHKTKYQFWLDLSKSGWLVEDIGNIYNAWAFQSDFHNKTFDYETLSDLTKDKTARILRKLSLLSTGQIIGVSSCYDSTGFENLYGILEFLTPFQQEISAPKNIVPRDDQRPVLEYKNGDMGIAAVPGAGKTTILLALIIKLLQDNTPPENIFVLTYMDSAAKHFKEKLLDYLPDLKTLPNISTIHGLCLKILKDNSNYVKVNLDPDFKICDELNRKSFIFEALFKSNLKEEDFSKYEKAISAAKLNPNIDINNKQHYQFKKFLENYNKILYENSMIDYDDMIFYAVNLLKNNPEILQSYQEQCHFIIEDEAQDSSLIQQQLLEMLSSKHKNLIRCGDPNQAITSTFTNADTKGFNNFIEKNQNVKMHTSQRCAKPIYAFANDLMINYQNSFYQNLMQGTKFNPQTQTPVSFLEFEQDNEEKLFILNSIKKIIRENPKSTIAILLRNNYQVENYSEFLQTNNIKITQKIDNLKNNKVFNIILAFLEMLEYPYNNKILADGIKKLNEYGLYNIEEKDIEKLSKLTQPFLIQNPEGFHSFNLSKFWWDFDYIFSNSNQDLDFLICFIADFYFNKTIDLENAYMLSQLAKSLTQNKNGEQTIIEKLKTLKNLVNLGNVRLIKDDENSELKNMVQIMTIHKSKGDEFDYVFIPEMSSKQFSLDIETTKISSENHFCECLKEKQYTKTMEQMKQEQIDETLHLIYVAVTRAKKQLYLSFSQNIKRGTKNLTPCKIFDLQNKSCNCVKNSD